MGHFFPVSFGQSFWFAWFRVRIWYISGSSHVCICISYYQRGLGVVSITYYGVAPPPFLTSKELFCACVVGEVPWLQEWEICGFLSSIWTGPSLLSWLSCYFRLGVSVHREQTPTVCPWGQSISSLSLILGFGIWKEVIRLKEICNYCFTKFWFHIPVKFLKKFLKPSI